MSKDEWLTRCAARFVERGGLTEQDAKAYAETCFDAQGGEFDGSAGYSPDTSR